MLLLLNHPSPPTRKIEQRIQYKSFTNVFWETKRLGQISKFIKFLLEIKIGSNTITLSATGRG